MSGYHKNALPPGHALAEYTIESVLGHGGFGLTYLARDTALGAMVAIKEYLPQEIATRDGKTAVILPNPSRTAVRDYHWGLKNFVKEARALARFKHSNIVRVLRFLEDNGTAYMVMEYEEGITLAQKLKQERGPMDETDVLRIVIPILNGLHAVHEANMLHLDIKPENIYLCHDGRPILIDFGSARQAITSAGHLQRIALTHGYAPMEQYPDKGKPGPWTDVYALGATMYRCISGKRPTDALERYRAVLDYKVDPLAPAAKIGQGRYQQNLLECIDWAMQIYPNDRPKSAREFQDSLMGVGRRASKKASASAAPPMTKLETRAFPVASSSVRHHASVARPQYSKTPPRRWSWGVVMAIGAVVAVVAAFWSEIKPYLAVSTSLWEKEAALEGSSGSNHLPPVTRQGPADKKQSPPPQTMTRQVSKAPGSRSLSRRTTPAVLLRTLSEHRDWVTSVAFSPDGTRLSTGSNDKTIRFWDISSGSMLGILQGQEYPITSMAYSANGKWLASAGLDGTVHLWNPNTGAQFGVLRGQGYSIYAVAISADSRMLAAGGKDRSVFVWELESGKRLYALEGHQGDIYALAFAPDSKTVASAGGDKKIRIWDTIRGQEVFALSGHRDKILSLAYSPDGRWLATGDSGNVIRIWNMANGALVHTLTEADHSVLSLAYSPDGRWLAAGTAGNDILLYDARTATFSQVLDGHRDYVQTLAFSPNGELLASGSRDKSIRLWKTK